MRYLTAPLIFPTHIDPISNGIIVINDDGKIVDLLNPEKDNISSDLPIEKFDGILCPGFVNTHCHLELSHLQGKLSQKNGLSSFIGEMVEKRNDDQEKIRQSMFDADGEMYANGIVAVGDISNTSASLSIKKKSKIFYHTFVELFDIFPDRTEKIFANGIMIRDEFMMAGQKSSIVPHAPYTVTDSLMRLICLEAEKRGDIICIHNQESKAENEMFETGTGKLIDKLQQLTGAYSGWKPTGKSSLASIIGNFPSGNSLQLVHNTFTNAEDVRAIQNHSSVYWCLCANANHFIESTIPDISMMIKEKCNLTVGTDSYASNTSLSVLDELKTISSHYPAISLSTLIKWATLNGASYLKVSDLYGSFEKGKSPGVNLITNIDLQGIKLTGKSAVKRVG